MVRVVDSNPSSHKKIEPATVRVIDSKRIDPALVRVVDSSSSSSVRHWKVGDRVVLHDLQKASYLNGKHGCVGGCIDKATGRYPIHLDIEHDRSSTEHDQKIVMTKAKNLKPAITVQRAIGDLPKLKAGEGKEETTFKTKPRTDFQKESRGSVKILYNHVTMVHTKRVVERYEQILK